MNEGKIKDSINKTRKLLSKMEILKEYKISNCNELDFDKKYSKDFKDIMFSDDYPNLYRTAMKNGDYDILLSNDSFFQFSYEKTTKKIRYQYYPNPFENMTYENFVKEQFGNEEGNEKSYLPEYEQYIDENTIIKYNKWFSIRYDYDKNEHQKYIHPISHLHIGLNNSTRIPLDYIVTPQLFVYIVCMLQFKDEWKKVVDDTKLIEEYKTIKKKALEIENNILDRDEKNIIFIN